MNRKELDITDFIISLFRDADHFLLESEKYGNDLPLQQRYLRVSILCAWAGFEGWLNKSCNDFLNTDNSLQIIEKGFLSEKKINLEKGEFIIGSVDKYESTESKIEFLLHRFGQKKLDKSTVRWQTYQRAKSIRDSIIHPKHERAEEFTLDNVKRSVKVLKEYLNLVSKILFGRKPL